MIGRRFINVYHDQEQFAAMERESVTHLRSYL